MRSVRTTAVRTMNSGRLRQCDKADDVLTGKYASKAAYNRGTDDQKNRADKLLSDLASDAEAEWGKP